MITIEDIRDSIVKHPIITIFLLILFLMPVVESISYWNKHPKKITCSTLGSCQMEVYSYQHVICWDYILLSRRHYSSSRGCQIPVSRVEKMKLMPFFDIKDVISRKENQVYSVYMTGDNNIEAYVTQYKNEADAAHLASQLKARIKEWQATPAENNEIVQNFSYEFVQ